MQKNLFWLGGSHIMLRGPFWFCVQDLPLCHSRIKPGVTLCNARDQARVSQSSHVQEKYLAVLSLQS